MSTLPLEKRVKPRHQADERSCRADHACHHHHRRHNRNSASSLRSHNAKWAWEVSPSWLARARATEINHHFRKRSALGRPATVMAIAPRAPISMIAAARNITVTPRRRFREVLLINEWKGWGVPCGRLACQRRVWAGTGPERRSQLSRPIPSPRKRSPIGSIRAACCGCVAAVSALEAGNALEFWVAGAGLTRVATFAAR